MTTYADTFNRADGPMGNSPTGSPYIYSPVNDSASWHIVSNEAELNLAGSFNGGMLLFFPANQSDVDFSMFSEPATVVENPDNFEGTGVVVRYQDQFNYVLFLYTAQEAFLYQNIGGVGATVASLPNPGPDDITKAVRITAVGNVYTCYHGSTTLFTWTDPNSVNVTLPTCGLWSTSSNQSGFLVQRAIDRFSAVCVRPPLVMSAASITLTPTTFRTPLPPITQASIIVTGLPMTPLVVVGVNVNAADAAIGSEVISTVNTYPSSAETARGSENVAVRKYDASGNWMYPYGRPFDTRPPSYSSPITEAQTLYNPDHDQP